MTTRASSTSSTIVRGFKLGLLMLMTTAIVACGGGGGAVSSATTDPLTAPSPSTSPNPSPPSPAPVANASCADPKNWSAAETWGGMLPNAGAQVVIPAGLCVVLDTSPPALANLTVQGTLSFADTADRHLQAGWIFVDGGALQIGASAAQPFAHRALITLNASNADSGPMPGMGTRGLFVNQGKLLLYGAMRSPAWTKLANHAAHGSTSLNLLTNVNWQADDEVVIAPTDFYGVSQSETRTVASLGAGGTQLNLHAGLTASRWGRLQYPAPAMPTGLSDAPQNYTHPNANGALAQPNASIPAALDQRAEVGNLSRRIIIEGAQDTQWTNNGFGAQTMIMGLTSTVEVDGVLFRRVGQNGLLGRYPFHWHMLSYGAGGAVLGDANTNGRTHVLRNSVISNSSHRCITIHGTNGVYVQNNICHNIRGHAIFIEDGVERRNVFEDNLIVQVRVPVKPVQNHDIVGVVERAGSSGFWITNPDNVIRRNVVADAVGSGFWYAIPDTPLGHANSKAVGFVPRHLPFGTFENNVAHSIFQAGLLFDLVPTDDLGNLTGRTYQPTANNQPAGEMNPVVTFTLAGLTTYKNRDGFWNRLNGGHFDGFVSADNTGKFFAGSSAESALRNSLVVGTSLNATNTWETLATSTVTAATTFRGLRQVHPPMAFASYHGGVAIYNNTVINMPHIANTIPVTAATDSPTGAFATDDYYLRPIERSLAQNFQNHLIHSSVGVRSTPSFSSFVFAGAVRDYEGLVGPLGNYWVYDTPFLTAGATCGGVLAGGNSRSCNGEYYGAEFFVLDKTSNEESEAEMALHISRRDPVLPDNILGNWSVAAPAPIMTLLRNMRHFAMRQNGVYVLDFPGYLGALTDVRMIIGNMHTTTDSVVLAAPYKGVSTPHVFATTSSAGTSDANGQLQGFPANPVDNSRIYIDAGSREQLISGPGNRYWWDIGSQLVWVKLQGGLADAFVNSSNPFSDEKLYAPFILRIRQ